MQKTIMLALLLACGTAQAAEWVSLGKDLQNREIFVDVSSVRIADGVRRAWFKTVYEPHTKRGSGIHADTWRSYTLTRQAFDCAAESFKTEAGTAYFDDNSNYVIDYTNPPDPWTPVSPESIGNSMLQFI